MLCLVSVVTVSLIVYSCNNVVDVMHFLNVCIHIKFYSLSFLFSCQLLQELINVRTVHELSNLYHESFKLLTFVDVLLPWYFTVATLVQLFINFKLQFQKHDCKNGHSVASCHYL